MPLLLGNAINAVDPEKATLVSVESGGGADVLNEPLPPDVVGGYAEHHDLPDANGHGVVLLLHGPKDAELTSEVVRCREHDSAARCSADMAPTATSSGSPPTGSPPRRRVPALLLAS